MTAKEYLCLPKTLREEILCDIDSLASMRSVVEDCTSHLSFTAGRNPSGNKNPFENVMLEITAEEEKIEAKKRKLLELVKTVLLLIRKLPEKKHQDVLRLRYINGLDWCEVAREIGVGENYAFLLHRDALAAFETVFAEEHQADDP